jgi:integrase
MALYKRGRVWHFDFTVKGVRYRGSTGFEKKADAAAFEDGERRAAKLGTASRREVPTVGEIADQWFRSRIAGKKTATTVAQRLKILFRHLDRNLRVSDIGPNEIEAAMIARRFEPIRQSKPNAPRFPQPATVNRDMVDTTLRPILAYADEMEHTVRRIKWAKLRQQEPKGRVREFSAEELAAWRAKLPAHHQPVFDFICRYGVRLGEAFFAPSAVNVEACEITLYDTKNGTDHALAIHEDDMPDLAARKARARAAKLDTIWFRDNGGRLSPIHWRAFQSASREALDAAGVLNARPVHDLRHHAATTLLRGSGNIMLVQDLLNHQDIKSSARYAHTNKDDLRKALRHTYGTKPETGEMEDNRFNDVHGNKRVT